MYLKIIDIASHGRVLFKQNENFKNKIRISFCV